MNAENPQQIQDSSGSSDIVPLDPTLLYSGSLIVRTSEATAQVGDTVQILVTITNNGLVDWNPVSLYIPVPNGTQFVSFVVPDRNQNLQNYDPLTGVWNPNNMTHIEKGQQKTVIIIIKVLPEAAGKTLSVIAKFKQLVLEGYSIDMTKQAPTARSATLLF